MIACLVFLLLAVANAYSDPGSCTGNCWTHDPGLYQRVSDGKYFRFATGGGIHISSANALEGPWTETGFALPGGSKIDHPGKDNLWAPDVHYNKGKYYMYYSVSTLGSKNSVIGVATSGDMEAGSWIDHGSTGLSSTSATPWNAIDPNWIEINGDQYINFGSYWQNLFQAGEQNGLKVRVDEAHKIAYNATGPGSGSPIEASFMVEHDGWYYLFFSVGQADQYDTRPPAPGQEYHIAVCRSSSGTGDFVDRTGRSCTNGGGTTVLESHGNVYAPGGQGVMNDNTRGLVLYYQWVNKTIGFTTDKFQFGWNVLKWVDGWPSV